MVFFLHIVTYDWKAIVIDDGGTFELACLARFLIDGDERSPIHRILREAFVRLIWTLSRASTSALLKRKPCAILLNFYDSEV